MKKVFLGIIALLVHLCLFAQTQNTIDPDKKTDWWGDVDGFLNQQAKVTLGIADDVLKL